MRSIAVAKAVGVALILPLGMAACGPSQDATPTAPAPPASAPPGADFSRPLNALGTEPFWSLKIRPEALTFAAADGPNLTAPNAGPKTEPAQAVWIGRAKDGQMLSVTLKSGVCVDDAVGASYPFKAEVVLAGRTLTGCAAYADAMPKAGG